ncbi:MFS transporter [Calidifontibacter terrae]
MEITEAPSVLTSSPQQRAWQRKWYWYDWACSAFVTATMTVLFGPYVTALANKAACPQQATDLTCEVDLHVLGIPIAPGSLAAYALTASTIISALVLIFVGPLADRSARPTRLLAVFTTVGALAAAALCLASGDNWQLAVVLAIIANMSLGCALIVYSALMIRITPPDDRDAVSTKGWSYGYLGGGLMLLLSLIFLSLHEKVGVSTSTAARIIFVAAGVWWIGYALITVTGLKDVPPASAKDRAAAVSSVAQLRTTFVEMRGYPQTMRFLIAYLFFNDGIQTVISAASLYGKLELKFSDTQLFLTILWVQFVAFGGALLFGRLARRRGAKTLILYALVLWTGVVAVAFFIPQRAFGIWMVLAVGIGLVMGGSQSLSRSLYSHLVPHGRESEFYSFYQAMERGTSWLGTLVFGLVFQLFHNYRLSIIALITFFVVGGVLLRRVDVRRGITDVGNQVPRIV